MKRYASLVENEQVIIEDYEEAISASPAAKILIMTNEADKLIAAANKELDTARYTIIKGSPHPFFVEFLHSDVTKGDGVKLICQDMGIDLRQVAAFGDGDNDKEMLQYAGLGCAMGNAKDPAKRDANIVLEWTNEEEGVARQLEKMFEEGHFHID